MIDLFRTPFVTDTKINFIEPDYEGIAKVLEQIIGLYKVCDNKELIDRLLENFMSNRIIQ